MRVLVHRRDKPGARAAHILLDGHPVRGLRHTGGMDTRDVLPLAHHSGDTVRAERRRLRDGADGAGIPHVAPRAGPRRRGGQGGRVVRLRAPRRRARGRGRRLRQAAGRGGDDRGGVLVAVHAPHRVEAHADHVRVPVPAAVERRVRAALLLGGRVPRLPRPGGRRHRVRVPGARPRGGRRRVRPPVPAPAQDAHGRVRHVHRRVAVRHRGLREGVRGRGQPAVRRRPGPGVHTVHVLQPAGDPAAALDTVRRGVPDGRQRYAPPFAWRRATAAVDNLTVCVVRAGTLNGAVQTWGYFVMFLVIKIYPMMVSSFGVEIVWSVFAACCVVNILFGVFVMPETKGKSLDQILSYFETGKKNSIPAQMT